VSGESNLPERGVEQAPSTEQPQQRPPRHVHGGAVIGSQSFAVIHRAITIQWTCDRFRSLPRSIDSCQTDEVKTVGVKCWP
jgi:hypothetical protein